MRLIHQGKVRDVYLDESREDAELIMVASDRASVYDVVLPTPIPDKGKILTQLSAWWGEQLKDIVPTHLLSSEDVPERWHGRAVRCRNLSMFPIECVARGYLTGGGWREYCEGGAVSGIVLPDGVLEAQQFTAPLFTPSSKAEVGEHDEPISLEEMAKRVGEKHAAQLRDLTLAIYARASEIARERGVIIADTKLEFGLTSDGEMLLADEVLTPDSSRFWLAEEYEPGRGQNSLDKQFLRDWAADSGWNKQPPAPEVPDEIVHATRERYLDAFTRLTGSPPVF